MATQSTKPSMICRPHITWYFPIDASGRRGCSSNLTTVKGHASRQHPVLDEFSLLVIDPLFWQAWRLRNARLAFRKCRSCLLSVKSVSGDVRIVPAVTFHKGSRAPVMGWSRHETVHAWQIIYVGRTERWKNRGGRGVVFWRHTDTSSDGHPEISNAWSNGVKSEQTNQVTHGKKVG